MIRYTATEGGARLTAGTHLARVKTAVEGMSSKGDQTIEVELDINGASLRDTLYNSERAAWRITQARRCFGFADETGDEIEFAAADLEGCSGYVEVALGEPKTSGKHVGKQFLEVKKYLPRDVTKPVTPQAPEDDEIPF